MKIQPKPIIHGRDHMTGGPDPIPGLPDASGDDFGGILMGHSPIGFWKLNETTGTTAHDSSGNGNDMEPGTGLSPPIWAQAESPLGEVSAFWGDVAPGGTNVYREACALTGQTNNFTAGIWANIDAAESLPAELIGQGQAFHGGGSAGWGLAIQLFGGVGIAVLVGGSAVVQSDAQPDGDTWYFIVTVRDAGTWKLYVNGLLQADTDTASPGSTSSDTWIGSDVFTAHSTFAHNTLMSYAFIVDQVLSGDEIMELYEAGTLGGVTEGLVWTALGDGTAGWRPPTIEVEY